MYRQFYKTEIEIKRVFEVLNLDIAITIGLDNLEEILNNLKFDEGIVVIKDVLQIEDFWPTENDTILRRNSRRNIELLQYQIIPIYVIF